MIWDREGQIVFRNIDVLQETYTVDPDGLWKMPCGLVMGAIVKIVFQHLV